MAQPRKRVIGVVVAGVISVEHYHPTEQLLEPSPAASQCSEWAGGPRLRLLLIDAPEIDQRPFGAVATLQLEAVALTGTSLSLGSDIVGRDR
jgi:hypothetical protein